MSLEVLGMAPVRNFTHGSTFKSSFPTHNLTPEGTHLLRLATFIFEIFAATFLAPLAAAQAPSVEAHVVDATTSKPIPDATVTIDGKVLPTDSGGRYTISADAKSIMARAPGYRAATFAITETSRSNGKLELTPFAVRALYLSEYGISSSILLNSAIEIIHRGGANALVINIKSDHGFVVYPSNSSLATSIGARKLTTITSLSDLIKYGHGQGIYMIARIVTFKDNPLATARPDLAVHLASGAIFRDREHLAWTDPFQPAVRAYNIAIAVEAAKAGFDEVQFDYVRFPDATTKLRLSRPTDERSRVRAISDFLAEAHEALAPYNVFEAVDIFGYVSWNPNDTGIGQQLEELTRIVDYVCPMLYPSGFKFGLPGHPKPMGTTDDIYNMVKLTLDNSISRTHANPKKFRPWLQAFRDYAFTRLVFGPTEVSAQIRAAADAHTDGWLLWNPHNHYTGIGLMDKKSTPTN
jgi:hypothetical protein